MILYSEGTFEGFVRKDARRLLASTFSGMLLSGALLLPPFSIPVVADTPTSGLIGTDTIWNLSGSP